MRKYTIFHPYLFSFFSADLYRDIAQRWRGLNSMYLLLLLALCWLVTMITLHWQFAVFITQEAPKIAEQIPNIKVENGKLSIDKPSPYVIKSPDTGETLVVFDMNGQFESLNDANTLALITPDRISVKRNEFETRSFEVAPFEGFTMDSTKAYEWASTFGNLMVPIAYPFAVIGSFLYRMVQVLTYGLLGMLFAAITGTKLPYAALVRLSVIAITPVLILDTVFGLFQIVVPMWALICFVIAMAYLFFGVISNRNQQPQQILQYT